MNERKSYKNYQTDYLLSQTVLNAATVRGKVKDYILETTSVKQRLEERMMNFLMQIKKNCD